MRKRCLNVNSGDYPNYGGRGITIVERWSRFSNFFADMGRRPSELYSLERRDNNAGYAPENCYWATKDQQANNTRKSRFVEWNGARKTVAQWSRYSGVPVGTLHNRLRAGWSLERMFIPYDARKKRAAA